jgi:hypothetical protein
MANPPRSVDQAIARFDDYAARLDGRATGSACTRRRRRRARGSIGKRITAIIAVAAALIVGAMAFGLFVAPIGWSGLFILALAILVTLIFFSAAPMEKRLKPYSDTMTNPEVVKTLDSFLHRQRPALPAPAAIRVNAITQQLPLLESRLAEVPVLDPLAQDARRLMGKHLPELIERYERVPQPYRQERDGEGMTVDERLVASLDAAREALDDIGRKLTQQDLNAFETQGRFIESRYKDDVTSPKD